MSDRKDLAELLRWYVESGADEAITEHPADRLAAATPERTPPAPPPPRRPAAMPLAAAPPPAPEAAASARALAAAAPDLAALERAIRGFTGCALKATATNTVFADGNPAAGLMLIGEAPGAEEDRQGKPFVGRSGQLLDRMLASIGIDRSKILITNALFWRPPGNRKPTAAEVATCLPFVHRAIALVRPRILILCGGTAAAAVLGTSEGITKLHGRWFDANVPDMANSVTAFAIYHPSYLLRSPARKKEAWRDLLSLQSKLQELR
jgi:DNA polymerase